MILRGDIPLRPVILGEPPLAPIWGSKICELQKRITSADPTNSTYWHEETTGEGVSWDADAQPMFRKTDTIDDWGIFILTSPVFANQLRVHIPRGTVHLTIIFDATTADDYTVSADCLYEIGFLVEEPDISLNWNTRDDLRVKGWVDSNLYSFEATKSLSAFERWEVDLQNWLDRTSPVQVFPDKRHELMVPKLSMVKWEESTAYSVDDWIVEGSWVYRCSTAGTSGSSKPIFTKVQLDTINDGSVVWTAYQDKVYGCVMRVKEVNTSISGSYTLINVLAQDMIYQNRGVPLSTSYEYDIEVAYAND